MARGASRLASELTRAGGCGAGCSPADRRRRPTCFPIRERRSARCRSSSSTRAPRRQDFHGPRPAHPRQLTTPSEPDRLRPAPIAHLDDSTILSASAIAIARALVRGARAGPRAWTGCSGESPRRARAETGASADHQLAADDIKKATRGALELMTRARSTTASTRSRSIHRSFAMVIDASVRGLMTTRRPPAEVANRLRSGAGVASPMLALADDPNAPGPIRWVSVRTTMVSQRTGSPLSMAQDRAGSSAACGGPHRTKRAGASQIWQRGGRHAPGTSLLDDGSCSSAGKAGIDRERSHLDRGGTWRAREWRGGGARATCSLTAKLVGDSARCSVSSMRSAAT